jgi:sec-independent protein translocase protein TatA
MAADNGSTVRLLDDEHLPTEPEDLGVLMLGNLTGVHLLIILGIVVLFFGAAKLPALAKGLGQSINIFKKEMATNHETTGSPAAPPVQTPAAQTTVAPQAVAPNTVAPQVVVPQTVLNPEASVQPLPETKA